LQTLRHGRAAVIQRPLWKGGRLRATIVPSCPEICRMVAAGRRPYRHGMVMLEVFRGVIEGTIPITTIKDRLKLEEVALELAFRWKVGRCWRSPPICTTELERPTFRWKGNPLPNGCGQDPGNLAKTGYRSPRRHAEDHGTVDVPIWAWTTLRNITKQCSRRAGRRLAIHGGHRNFGYPLRHPHPVVAEVNMGCLKEDQVNIIIHAMNPISLSPSSLRL